MLREFFQELDQDMLMNMMMVGPPWLILDSETTPKGGRLRGSPRTR